MKIISPSLISCRRFSADLIPRCGVGGCLVHKFEGGIRLGYRDSAAVGAVQQPVVRQLIEIPPDGDLRNPQCLRQFTGGDFSFRV